MQAPAAGAQAGFLGKCAQIIMKYVGVPLTAGMLNRGGELLVDHFAGRLQAGEAVTITSQDVATLQAEGAARGLSECEVRQMIEQAFAEPPSYDAPSYDAPSYEPPIYDAPSVQAPGYAEPAYALPPPYAAEAYCSGTGALGFTEGESSPDAAIFGAIYDCVRRGGIPQCCEAGAVLLQ